MGIDLGTQGIKVIIYDPKNKSTTHTSSFPFELISHSDGTREQLAQWWIEGLHQCINSIPNDTKKDICAIGVSGQQHGFVPLNDSGEVLAPVKLWCDTATDKECEDLIKEIGGEKQCIALSGGTIKTGYTISKIRWLRDHKPELYQRMTKVLLPHDYLNFYLTGNYRMECGDASGTGLLNARTRTWSQALIEKLDPERDLSTCFPQLIEPYDQVGTLRPELAKALGLSSDVIVSAGGGDNMMSAIGTGNVVNGKLTASLGTSGTLFAFCDEPHIDLQGELAAFCSSTGGWLPLLCTMNCTVATEQLRNLFNIKIEHIEDLAQSIPIGAEGVLTLPFYNGERTPNLPHAQAVIFGLGMANTTQGHLLRSAMEAAVFSLKTGLLAFERNGMVFKELTLTGGGSESALWCQICADVLNLPVRVLDNPENAAFGALLQALWCYQRSNGEQSELELLVEEHLNVKACKRFSPNIDQVQCYQNIYQNYQALLETITPLYQT
jgi:xylulokinase